MNKVKLIAGLLLAGLYAALSYGEPDPGPVPVVTSFHEALTAALKAGSYEHRLTIVRHAVSDFFQIHTIARISLGRYWRSLSAEEQTSYEALLQDLITSTYASRFKEDNGQLFSIVATESIVADRERVRSILTTKSETVTLDYQLQHQDGNWLIYDIVANGVSDLSLKRSSYSAIFSAGGLESVRQEIRANIAGNEAEQAE